MKNLPLESQVCALKQAKKLAELLEENAPRSYFVWVNVSAGYGRYEYRIDRRCEPAASKYWKYGSPKYNAYSGDELGALLPGSIKYDASLFILICNRSYDGKGFISGYEATIGSGSRILFIGDKRDSLNFAKIEAHSKAALAIQGLEEGWIKKEDFNYNK